MRLALRIVIPALLCAAVPARAQPADATGLSGEWSGTYVCSQGSTGLVLALQGNAHGIVRGTFTFSPTPQNPDVLAGSYPVLGRLTGTALVLRPVDVLAMPGSYVPVGIQATVQGNRITGWIEGPGCGALALERSTAAAPAGVLSTGREWVRLAESDQGALFVDGGGVREDGGSTVRVWSRWQVVAAPQSPLAAGQVAEWEWEMELDCPAGRVRTWHTLLYAPDGQLQDVDASAPYRWHAVMPGSLEEHVYQHACEATLPRQ
jgi:hypothetical protein